MKLNQESVWAALIWLDLASTRTACDRSCIVQAHHGRGRRGTRRGRRGGGLRRLRRDGPGWSRRQRSGEGRLVSRGIGSDRRVAEDQHGWCSGHHPGPTCERHLLPRLCTQSRDVVCVADVVLLWYAIMLLVLDRWCW